MGGKWGTAGRGRSYIIAMNIDGRTPLICFKEPHQFGNPGSVTQELLPVAAASSGSDQHIITHTDTAGSPIFSPFFFMPKRTDVHGFPALNVAFM